MDQENQTETEPNLDPAEPEEIAAEQPIEPVRVVKSMPVSEVREDMLICQWHTQYEEVDRSKVAGADAAQPGDRVDVFSDGAMALVSMNVARETTRVVSAPAAEPEA